MEQNLEQIKQLLALFDKRQTLRNACNREIAAVLSPTVLSALFELVNVPTSDIVWEDIDVIQSVLVIRTEITYSPAQELSPYLNLVMPPLQGETPIQIQRTITLGVPLTMVFEEKETIKGWLMSVARENAASREPTAPPPQDQVSQFFNVAELTKEQMMQLLYFQQNTKGTTQ